MSLGGTEVTGVTKGQSGRDTGLGIKIMQMTFDRFSLGAIWHSAGYREYIL